jgi:hypothetical protein
MMTQRQFLERLLANAKRLEDQAADIRCGIEMFLHSPKRFRSVAARMIKKPAKKKK